MIERGKYASQLLLQLTPVTLRPRGYNVSNESSVKHVAKIQAKNTLSTNSVDLPIFQLMRLKNLSFDRIS
jgi:hypothetical protein